MPELKRKCGKYSIEYLSHTTDGVRIQRVSDEFLECQGRINPRTSDRATGEEDKKEMTESSYLVNAASPCRTAPEWERLAEQAEFNLAKMTALFGLSLRHLERVFREYFHCTPTRWLRELRCRRAKRLILKGYSSKAAAAELKYATNSHFCREFKKVFGVSPQSLNRARGTLITPI